MDLRDTLKRSSAAPVLAMPYRVREVSKAEGPRLTQIGRWLLKSREMTNFTYELHPLNMEHLAWFVAAIAGATVEEIRLYLAELETDGDLREHIKSATLESDLRHFADPDAHYCRRAGWYALIRALGPEHVVETGTDKGLGSCVIAAALLANGTGQLTTIDIDPAAGYLIQGPFASVTTVIIGDSVEALKTLGPVDVFLHDSDHSGKHEQAEYEAVTNSLSSNSVVLSDNSHVTDRLPKWAEATRRQFAFFQEVPVHWYRGGGIGAAWSRPR